MKNKLLLLVFLLLLTSCSGATIKYRHKPYSSITASKPLVLDFEGAYLEPDSGRVLLSILGTRPDFVSFFGVPFDTFFTKSIRTELDSVENWKVTTGAPLKLRFVIDRFVLTYRIDDIGEQPNGVRYEYVFDCRVKGRAFLNTSDGELEIPVQGRRHSRWFLYLWGAWQPTLQDELDMTFSQVAEELVKGISTRLK